VEKIMFPASARLMVSPPFGADSILVRI